MLDLKKLELLREKDKLELRLNSLDKVANKEQLSKLSELKQNFKSSTCIFGERWLLLKLGFGV